MSVLKVATVQDLAAANSSTPEQIAQGRAKAWCNFNGTGTPAFRDSYGCSSITDHGTGDYTINYSITMANTNYGVVFGWNSATVTTIPYFVAPKTDGSTYTSKTTTALRIIFAGTGGISTDALEITAAIFGD